MNDLEFTSGFDKLEAVVPNWNKARIIIVAGRPSIGKTAFSVSLARNIAIDQKTALAFFSMEMSEKQLKNRFVSNICELDWSKINNKTLNEEETTKYEMGLKLLIESPIKLVGSPGLSVPEFSSKSRQLVNDFGAKIIFVDYLQLMKSGQENIKDKGKEHSFILHSIRKVAEELDVPIVVNTYLPNRARYSRIMPCLADIKRIGNIERLSDVILFLHQPELYYILGYGPKYTRTIQIIVAKNNDKEKDSFLLGFMPEFSRFYN